MTALFPGILYLGSYIAPAILRIGVGIVFLLIAKQEYKNRVKLGKLSLPFFGFKFGPFGAKVIALLAGIQLIISAMLILGVFTQGAAIAGILFAIDGFTFRSLAHTDAIPSKLLYFLLGIACVALLLSGAGTLAIDLPY